MNDYSKKHQNVDLKDFSSSSHNLLYYSSSKFNSYANLLKVEYDLSATTDPTIVNDENPEDTESNISLIYKQPSYMSLSDIIVTKSGDVIYDSNSILNTENDSSSNGDFSSKNNKNNLIINDQKLKNDNSNEIIGK